MNLNLVPYDDPILTTPTEEFDFRNPPVDPAELAQSMADIMTINGGIGLAANQVGFPYRMFVMATNPVFACFNPEIIDYSEEAVSLEEGCLSYPGLVVKVARPKSCKIRFIHPNGEPDTRTYTGMTARIVLHEIQHLDGERYIDTVDGWYEKEKVKRWKIKYARKKK